MNSGRSFEELAPNKTQLIRTGESFRDPKTRHEIGVLDLKPSSTHSGCESLGRWPHSLSLGFPICTLSIRELSSKECLEDSVTCT